jgi:oxygen-independent coproporphyrinogen-3 oxidase
VLQAQLSFAGAVRLAVLPPLALYAHLPWCVRKCPYCDFNSHERGDALPEREYVDALVADLEAMLPAVWGRRLGSIFIGGGTPSLFSPEAIDRLLAAVRARLTLEPGADVTLEANPGTAEAGRFRGYRAAGVNRLSLGIQSFDDGKLRSLGRIHSAQEARRAIEMAQASFENINLDLMYGLPGKRRPRGADVGAALAAPAPFFLSPHDRPNTVFFTRPPPLPDEDASAEIGDTVDGRLRDAGYDHYETSAYAQPGRACRHNLNYWRFGDYLGIGAGAHAKISFADRIVRETRTRTPAEYMRRVEAGTQVVERRELGRSDLPFEFMMNALRLAGVFRCRCSPSGPDCRSSPSARSRRPRRASLERDQRIRPTARPPVPQRLLGCSAGKKRRKVKPARGSRRLRSTCSGRWSTGAGR